MGYSQHASVLIVGDGTDTAAKQIQRALWNDPATGVMRYADARYGSAIEVAKTRPRENVPDVAMVDPLFSMAETNFAATHSRP